MLAGRSLWPARAWSRATLPAGQAGAGRQLAGPRRRGAASQATAETPRSTPTEETLTETPCKTRSRTLLAGIAAVSLAAAAPALAQKVKLATSQGDIVLELDPAKAPKTVDNFVQYVKAGHYDGTVFHRVINNFMIQGGGMTADLKEKPTRAPIMLESRNGLTNQRGTVAMARTNDPNSASAQLFINVKDNDFLNQAQARDGNGYAYSAR